MTYGSWQTVMYMYVMHVEGGIEQVFSTFNCYTSLEIPEVNSSHKRHLNCLQHATRTDDFGT